MNKQQAFHYQISLEDWRKTPTNVKLLIEEMEECIYQLDLQLDKLPIHNQFLDTYPLNKINLVIVIPVLNDWEALEKLLLLIDEIVFIQEINIEVLIVDDYSTKPVPHSLLHQEHRQIRAINILRLRRNLGHQRAIAVGLSYVYHHLNCNCVVVMDGDGEDNPFEIERLLNAFDKTGRDKIIFAKRTKRSESNTFKFLYCIYKQLYRLLTGREICVGNFSLLPASLLRNAIVISEIWNHYSSGIYRSRIPYLEVNVPRTRRLAGQPKMNLVSLITHGLSSIAVYGDIVATRILLVTAILFVTLLFILCIVLLIKIFTNLAIPGWATYVSGLVLISLLQLILIGAVFSMIILSDRNNSNIIPGRDYKDYVDNFFNLKL
ncbi:glycosyltransferase [Chlorogloeopsis sp. ULAP01]|uniref:glycosyltransferase n=1 Tax=Chlorogloeopsis sp. ULAP01 TaxID=3056483 RepID=UPI0025AAE093|nr:glycosyltransferase [Chlorogloeopsis sp. ULAP01]MDM9383451.1 glycosyltransferase [Chlorogloeopsis sp. ULAP01]